MNQILLAPPIAFLILLSFISLMAVLLSGLSARVTRDREEAKKSYACGEDFSGNMIQPDYSQFFPFAFFFTILHVVALVIATMPVANAGTFAAAIVYVAGALLGLIILLRK